MINVVFFPRQPVGLIHHDRHRQNSDNYAGHTASTAIHIRAPGRKTFRPTEEGDVHSRQQQQQDPAERAATALSAETASFKITIEDCTSGNISTR